MIRICLVSKLLLSASVLTSAAADLPSKTVEPEFEEPPPIPIFSWSGFYAGLHAGAILGHDNATVAFAGGGAGKLGSSTMGLVGGAHAGFDYSVAQVIGEHALIAGLEADIDGADLARSASAYGDVLSTKSDLKGSIRGRVGVAASRILYFATGGLALADVESRYRIAPISGSVTGSATDKTVAGYTVGAGVEYAFMNDYALRAEYRTSRYGAINNTLVAPAPGAPMAISHRETDNRLQAGVSYRFQSPAALQAVESN